MKKVIQVFIDVADGINIIIAAIASVFFIPLVGLGVYEVITRRIFGSPTIWTLEMTRFVFVPIVILSIGYTLLVGGHATIDLFSEKFKARTRAIVNTITIILFLLPSSIVMFINSYRATAMSWASLERTPSAFNAPIYPVKTMMPIGFAALILAAVSWLLKNIYFLKAKEKIESKIMMKLKPGTDTEDL